MQSEAHTIFLYYLQHNKHYTKRNTGTNVPIFNTSITVDHLYSTELPVFFFVCLFVCFSSARKGENKSIAMEECHEPPKDATEPT